MTNGLLYLGLVWAGVVLTQAPGAPQSSPSNATSSPPARPIGVVTRLQPGTLTLHADAGADLAVQFPPGVKVLRVPPGAKDLKAATKITAGDISLGDRVLVFGHLSDDQKSLLATSIIVMSKTELASAHAAESLEWQRRGIGGLVRVVNPATKEITISVPNTPPTPSNPTHPVVISLAANAELLRYAPDSVKFSDAKSGTFEEIQVGDQVRALGTKSEDGSRFIAEKLVSGTFHNIGATVISVDAPSGTLTVKDLASGKTLVVRTDRDSKLHRLPPFIAQMIAAFNSGGRQNGAPPGQPGAGSPESRSDRGPDSAPRSGAGSGPGGHPGGPPGQGPHDFQQMLEHAPALSLDELKPGAPLIVVSTQGAKPSDVTAIIVLAGVEPILSARPKGSNEVVLGPWNMTMSGGEGGP